MIQPEQSSDALPAAVAPSVMREMNQRLLLDRLFTGGPAIRPNLARDTGLSLPTVIAALAGLEQAGLVRTAGRPEPTHGRPATAYEADPTSGAVVGVDIGHDWLHLLVTDLSGARLSGLDVRNQTRSASALVERTLKAVADVTAEADLDPEAITHTVIGSPGVYDPGHGRIRYAANLPGWQRTGLAEALGERLRTTLTIENDANLAALGEYNYGAARNARNFVYLTIGTGVGLGLVLDGRLYRGATGAAGEASYLPFGDTPTVPRPNPPRPNPPRPNPPRPSPPRRTQPRRNQPRRGMLEQNMAADAVVRYAREAGLPGPLTAERVFAAARAGERRAGAAVAREAERLAQLVATVLALFDPELIVFGGGVGQNLDLLEADLRTALADLTPMVPTLAVGHLGDEAVVMGAVATGITAAREDVFKLRIGRPGSAPVA